MLDIEEVDSIKVTINFSREQEPRKADNTRVYQGS